METTIDPEKIYEKEIARLQSECGTLESEKRNLEHRNGFLNSENARLEDRIQDHKDEILKLKEKQKEVEENFKQSHANSLSALEKMDDETVARSEAADKETEKAGELTRKANAARNQLIALAEDIGKTLEKVKSGFESSVQSVAEELNGYLALKEPTAEIPEAQAPEAQAPEAQAPEAQAPEAQAPTD